METLTIKKDDALKIYKNATSKGKTLLENLLGKKTFLKDIKDRINSVDDAIVELGENDPEVIQLRKLQEIEIADNILARQEAVVLIKAYNEGWEPDWTDDDQYKYSHRFYMGGSKGSSAFRCDDYGIWNTGSNVGSRLFLKSSDLVYHTGEKHLEVFKRFHY